MTPATATATTAAPAKPIAFVSEDELIEMLDGPARSTFISLVIRTIPRLKVACPFDVVKVAKHRGLLHDGNYEDNVNRQRGRENKSQTFEASTSWHRRTSDNSAVSVNKNDDGSRYVRFRLQTTDYSEYRDAVTDMPIADELVKPFEYAKSKNRQGTDKPIIIITIKVENVLALTLNGIEYRVRH